MRNTGWIKVVLTAAAIVAIVVIGGKYLHLQDLLGRALGWIEEQGMAGMGVFALLYIVACVFFIPGSLLTLGAGAIYGVVTGSILVSVSSTLGATAAFLVGRYLARNWIAHKIEGNARFSAIDNAVADDGWRIVGLTRLSPVFSFTLLNYVYGLSRVSLKEYVLASWIGMMPGTVMYVYIGSMVGDLSAIGGETAAAPTALQWTVNAVMFTATVLVTVYVTRIARKALAEKLDE